MLSISFGSENRGEKISEMLKQEPATAVILAAVHFEWMIKRAILKLGISPTKELRAKLEKVYHIKDVNGRSDYKTVWKAEIARHRKHSELGTVIGRLERIQTKASEVRDRLVHGNGTVSKANAEEAVNLYLEAAEKIRVYVLKNGENIDTRLKQRRRPRKAE